MSVCSACVSISELILRFLGFPVILRDGVISEDGGLRLIAVMSASGRGFAMGFYHGVNDGEAVSYMPLSGREFEELRKRALKLLEEREKLEEEKVPEKVLEFLRRNRNYAYEASELAEAIGRVSVDPYALLCVLLTIPMFAREVEVLYVDGRFYVRWRM